MTLSQEQLEWIVSEVVRRLRAAEPTTPPPSPACAGQTLRVAERLVTLDSLRGRLDGVARVEVASRAIVTPAVVDELKQRGVTLSRTIGGKP